MPELGQVRAHRDKAGIGDEVSNMSPTVLSWPTHNLISKGYESESECFVKMSAFSSIIRPRRQRLVVSRRLHEVEVPEALLVTGHGPLALLDHVLDGLDDARVRVANLVDLWDG